MFPSVKGKEQQTKSKVKEKQWDDRFNQNQAPQYSPLRDKHTKSYRKVLMSNSVKGIDEELASKKMKKKTFFEKKLELLSTIREVHPDQFDEIRKYEDGMNKQGAPNFYSYYSLMPLLNCTDVKGYLLTQTKLLRQKTSSYHRLSTSIRAREQCLQRMRKTIIKAKQEQIMGMKDLLKEQVSHLRLLTTNAIDQVKRWRDELGKMDEKPIYFSDDQENYLIKMLNDTKFIFTSQLSNLINFGDKNDPFLLAPLKKAEGKEKSQFLEIIELQKDISHYKRYMDYLASEKAYQLSVTMDQGPSSSNKKFKNRDQEDVQKIYGQTQREKKGLKVVNQAQQQDEDVKLMEKQRQREDRLKRNQERMNSIKGIYETYTSRKKGFMSEKKFAQTDVEDKKETMRIKKNKPEKQDQFNDMVSKKLTLQKQNQSTFRKTKQVKQNKSMTKLNTGKNEDKMIQNLRGIQQTLKNKLQLIQKEDKPTQQNFVTTKYTKKNNEELIKELKLEIIQKIDKEAQEKDRVKKKKREEEDKILQEIKSKMKKQMEDKLEQKRKEKMIQREELQKKLKQQEERLNNQRQMEIQLQMKLNRQRQMRELQKIRRQALEKEKKFKEELQKEQNLRRQRQQAIEKERKEKEKLLEELKKKQLRDQIEEDLKKEMMEKKKFQDEKDMKIQLEALKKQKQGELAKQIELIKLKEQSQMTQIQKENQIRQKMLIIKQQEEQLQRKQVQYLQRNLIQHEKQQVQREALEKRIELEESMRNNVKQKMLQDYKIQKEAVINANQLKREKELQEEVYRQKIKEKIEREMRMQAINKTKKDLEQRQSKKYEMKSKLQNIKTNLQVTHKIDKHQIEDDVKKEMIERVIFDKQAERQNAKTSLRAQFQRDLLSSAIPQIYQPKDSYLKKNTEHYLGDDHLNKQLNDKPINQKPSRIQETPSKPRELKSLLTTQELQIYSKKKSKVSEMRDDDPINKPPRKLDDDEQQGFQLMKVDKTKRQSENQYDVKIIRQQKKKERDQDDYPKKKKNKRKDDSDSDQEYQRRKKKKKNKKKRKQTSSESEIDSQQEQKQRKKKKNKKKKRRQTSEEEDVEEEYRSPKKKLEFRTSEEEGDHRREKKKSKIEERKKSKVRKPSTESQENKDVVVHYDVQKKKQPNFSQIQPITIKKSNMKQQITTSNKFQISLQAIPEHQLDQYLQGHFARLPQDQTDILPYQRQQLYRKLIGQLTFCLLLGHFDNKLIGMAYAYHDRNRSDLRKFVIVHIGTYKTQHLKQFILSTTNYIFKKDPSDQIQFHYHFDETKEDELAFSTEFNKWFDKYGNVYQKRLQSNQYERKYVLKRQFNQKCQVVLGGVNKNTFRNIFSVYSGVMMSDADMLQFKEELRDSIVPQDQISYAIMIAQLFRSYLTPDEAQALKGKVKEFVKLKQLLVLVVMLQKKKIKLQELKLYEYKSLIELNMRLMSQGKQVIRYCKDSGIDLNRIFYCQLNHGFNLPFNFQTTSLPVQAKENQVRQISYFRLAPLPPFKLHIMKSALYNAQLNILPTENSKYKIFIINAQQYMELRQLNRLDLFMYIRLFLKNVKSHNPAQWKYVWMPEMTDKGSWGVRQFKSFLSKDIYAHDSINISYRQFLPNALIIEPEHRDLVITPPFIVGVMSMTLEQVTEGSPLYARLIDVDALRTLEIEQ